MGLNVVKVDFSENFINLCTYFIKNKIKEYGNIVFITPNRRPIRFIEKNLSAKISISVDFYTIEDFINKLCFKYKDNLIKHSKLERIIFFLKLIKKNFKKDYEAFIWAEKLSRLFNDFDKQMIKPKNIEYAEVPKEAEKILKNLEYIFEEYQTKYKFAFEGRCFYLAHQIAKEIKFKEDFKGYAFIFAGFGSMSKSELAFIETLRLTNDIYFLLQTDLKKRDTLEKSTFDTCWVVNKLIKELKPDRIKTIENRNNSNPQIELFEFDSKHSEASFIAKKISDIEIKDISDPLKAAVILPESDTLFPLLGFLQDKQENLNITMGYPFKLTSFGEFIKSLFDLLIDSSRNNFNFTSPKLLLRLINSPFSKYIFSNIHTLKDKIYNTPSTFVDLKGDIYPFYEKLIKPFTTVNSFKTAKEAFYTLLNQVDRDSLKDNEMDLYTLDTFYKDIINSLPEEEELEVDLVLLYHIVNKSLEEMKIPFEGHPLKGIQILGALESRLLNFETIFIADVNEGILPKGDKIDPLIPEDLKELLGLTTFFEKERLMRYNFFRLVYSAKKVHISYRAGSTSDDKSIRSRYIEQLILTEEIKKKKIKLFIYEPTIRIETKEKYPKTDKEKFKTFIEKKLQDKGFSPSEINEFVNCPYAFYLGRVKGIKQRITFDERFEANKIGSIIHLFLEKQFKKYTSKNINKKEYIKLKKRTIENCEIEKIIDTLDNSNTEKISEINDLKNYIKKMDNFRKESLEIVLKFRIEKFFENTLKDFMPFRVLATEKLLTYQDKKIKTFGVLDRVDEILDNHSLRIIDYKTGYYSQGYKKNKLINFEPFSYQDQDCCEFLKDLKSIYESLQIPIYMIIAKENYSEMKNIYGEVYYLANSKENEYREIFEDNNIDKHREVIEKVFEMIKNCENPCAIPSEKCSFCSFNHFCIYAK